MAENPVIEIADYAAYSFATMLIVSAAPELREDVKVILESAIQHAPALVSMMGSQLVASWLEQAKDLHASRQPEFADEAEGGDSE